MPNARHPSGINADKALAACRGQGGRGPAADFSRDPLGRGPSSARGPMKLP